MSEHTNYRKERIERLLLELRYEVERGMVDREIEEQLSFVFIVPLSTAIPSGVVWCEFRTRPMLSYMVPSDYLRDGPKLRVINGGKS